MAKPSDVRKGQGSVRLGEDAFADRFRERFADPAFDAAAAELTRLSRIAWGGYSQPRKSPRTRKAGSGHADPNYDLSVDWLAARAAIEQASERWRDAARPGRILGICASPRSDQTCPGEMSKTYRLVQLAREIVETAGPRWVAAHGILIAAPVHWNQAPSVLKLMMDRLVCADGGNPDPTSTGGKDAAKAKALELAGWDYPRHLAGRAFALVIHADTEGAQTVRQALTAWLAAMHLIEAGSASIDRYVGYCEPYATSHQALDRDLAFQEEVSNAARALVAQVQMMRHGRREPVQGLEEPRKK